MRVGLDGANQLAGQLGVISRGRHQPDVLVARESAAVGAHPQRALGVLVHGAHGVGHHVAGHRDQLGLAEPVHAAGRGADPEVAFAVLEHGPHGFAAQALQGVVAVEACGGEAAQPLVEEREPDVALAVAVQGIDAVAVERGGARVALETASAEEGRPRLGARPDGALRVQRQAVNRIVGQAPRLVVNLGLAIPHAHRAQAIGRDPDAAGRVGHDGAVEAARREPVIAAQKLGHAAGHSHHAGIGGEPERAFGVADDAEHAFNAGGQGHGLEASAVLLQQAAVERAHPQRAFRIGADGGDGGTLQRRGDPRVNGVEARAAVVHEAAVGGQPDRAVAALGDGQHRALRQLVLVPDVGELPDGAVGVERRRGRRSDGAQKGTRQQSAETERITKHAAWRTGFPTQVAPELTSGGGAVSVSCVSTSRQGRRFGQAGHDGQRGLAAHQDHAGVPSADRLGNIGRG